MLDDGIKCPGGGPLIKWVVRLCIILIGLTLIITIYQRSNVAYIIKEITPTNHENQIPVHKAVELKAKERYINTNNLELETIKKLLPANKQIKTPENSGIYSSNIQHQGVKKRRLPQAIIFGVKKCGTHALTDMISLHPQVKHAKAYELHFFDKNKITNRDTRYKKGLEFYRKKMPLSFEDQITMEKTPSYFISADAPKRIHDMNSSIKLILIVREPTTRVVSDYIHTKDVSNGITLKSFEEEVIKQNGEVDKWNFVVKPSLYAVHMARWLEVFKRNQILIVDGDKLISDPLSEITRVEKFLNLMPYVRKENLYWNPDKGFYCMRTDVNEWCLSKTKGRPHPEMDPKTISKLRRFFAPLNERFYKMVGHNFSWPIS